MSRLVYLSTLVVVVVVFFFYQFESEKIVHVIPSDSLSCLNHNMPLC